MGKERKVLLFALLATLCGTTAYANENAHSKKVETSQIKATKKFDENTAKISTGIHGYTVDFVAMNSRTLSNTMLNRALTRDYLKDRPVNSWTQDILYMDNSHELGGLMDVDYDEHGILGVSERQILPNGRIGLVYGGSNGKAKFNGGESGDVTLDGAYAGGYYQHDFNDTWALNSRALLAYTHNRVDRMYNGELIESNYPIYSFGLGSSLIYTLRDDNYNKAYFYGGIDINRIHQGNINENEDKLKGQAQGSIKNVGSYPNEKAYYSIVPSAGFLAENTGYIWDRKYRVGASVGWETELGNIKDGKRITNLVTSESGGKTAKEYKIDTEDRENVFSYSIFGALDVTENLAVNAKYTSMFSDGYDANMIGAGFEYKLDTMARNRVIGPVIYGLENHKLNSDKWKGTLTLGLYAEDDTDIASYDAGYLTGADNITSTKYKPQFQLNLNNTKSKWQYYFEGYYWNNSMFQGRKGNELQDQHATRIHGEAKWVDSYSKGKYGFTIGYRNETSEKTVDLAYKDLGPAKRRDTRKFERGVHQLRLAPNVTYDLGHGFMFTGRVNGIFEYNYKGDRENQTDFLTETDLGIVYSGFMPQWKLTATYHRDDKWYDDDFSKVVWDDVNGGYVEKRDANSDPKRWHLAQFRPSIVYNFGNNSSFKFDMRIPLGNGAWTNSKDGKKSVKEDHEVRYGFTYSQQVAVGINVNVGATFVPTKFKSNGNITRKHSFRPNIGFSYSF